MAQVTKYRCDFCNREVEDPYLEAGWLKISGGISRSWGIRSKGRDGDARTDFLKDQEFCNVECMVGALNRFRQSRRGPDPTPAPRAQPWEDPLPDDEGPPSDDAVRAYESSIGESLADLDLGDPFGPDR